MNYTLMNTPMTKATLDGRKTQTRRVIKLPKDFNVDSISTIWENYKSNKIADIHFEDYDNEEYEIVKPKYQIGETIWVREPVEVTSLNSAKMTIGFHYGADEWIVNEANKMSIPERFIDMDRASDIVENFDLIKPKWIRECQGIPNGCIKEMARIFLKVTDVRVERLQDMTFQDIVAEGFDVTLHDGTKGQLKKEALKWWINLWNSTAPKGYKYIDNPYVFCYTFKVIGKKDI